MSEELIINSLDFKESFLFFFGLKADLFSLGNLNFEAKSQKSLLCLH